MFNKKAQAPDNILGGVIVVIVFGIIFFAFWPFVSATVGLAADAHTGSTKGLIQVIPFVFLFGFLAWVWSLGGVNT